MKQTFLALAALAVLTPAAALADSGFRAVPVQDAHPSYGHQDDRGLSPDQRAEQIKERIDHGVRNGRITRREAGQLQRQFADVKSKERRYLADGRLDRRETTALNRDLDRLAYNVSNQLHDNDRQH